MTAGRTSVTVGGRELQPVDATAARVVGPGPRGYERERGYERMIAPPPGLRHGPAPSGVDLTGHRRDRLTVVGWVPFPNSRRPRYRWVVRCDCGDYALRTNSIKRDGPDSCERCNDTLYHRDVARMIDEDGR